MFAVSIAGRNVAEGAGGPFGATVVEVDSCRVVAAGVNVVIPTGDCTAHAERGPRGSGSTRDLVRRTRWPNRSANATR